MKEKLKFIEGEILTLTIIGGLGRGYPVYKNKKIRETDKDNLKTFLKRELYQYRISYKNRVGDKQHIKYIKKFAQDVTNKYYKILRGKRFRIGRAQKLLNLYLKYLWALGLIPEPPHCPLDNKIISELNLNVGWTKIDSIDDYKKIVEKAKKIAKNSSLSIAEWELKAWSRK